MEKNDEGKASYSSPEVKDYGSLRELTRSSIDGGYIDVPYGSVFGDEIQGTYSETH